METEIWKKIVEEEIVESASIHSYNSAASRLRAAAAAAQPAALAMLNSVRGLGGGGLGGGGLGGGGLGGASMGQSLFSPAPSPSTSSIYEMAILQQRLALEEQSRRRVVAQAAASMRQQQHQLQGLANLAQRQHQQQQQQQLFQTKKRPAPVPKISQAMDRLLKKRKVVDLPPLSLNKQNARKNSDGFILPKVGGKDYTPTIKSLSSFNRGWKKLVAKANSKGVNEEEKHAFVRFHFEKTLLQNRALRHEEEDEDEDSEMDSDEGSDDVSDDKKSTEVKEELGEGKDAVVKKEAV